MLVKVFYKNTAKYPHDLPVILGYGGGTNSSAILVELIKRGYPAPKAIIFADTGAEQPHTYSHIKIMSEYSVKNGYPEITIVRNVQPSKKGGIYEMCLENKVLPSVAYGFKNCSVQFKAEPANLEVKRLLGKDADFLKIIGYDFDEIKRSENSKGKGIKGEIHWFPLIEWEMGRDECVQSLVDAGLPLAGKSSCFFCPNMRKNEIKKLAKDYPELAAKAIAVEDAAAERRLEDGKQSSIYGLGRTWTWRNLLSMDDMFDVADVEKPLPCGCYDGDD